MTDSSDDSSGEWCGNHHDDSFIDLTQYAGVVRNIVESFGRLAPTTQLSSISWTIECINECYQTGGSQPHRERTMDVVTALSWLMSRMVSAIDDPHEFVHSLITELLEVDVPELEAAGPMPRVQLDPRFFDAVSELEINLDELRTADEEGGPIPFALREGSIAEFMLQLDEPDIFDKLRDSNTD